MPINIEGILARWIERRLGGFRHPLNDPDTTLPRRLALADGDAPPRVAVVGAGLAGISAASVLAKHGFAVTLLERNDYIGGKLGAWRTTLPNGDELGVSHGFHAFFHHYYNLDGFLGEIGATRHYRNIGDYQILARDGRAFSFADVATTPILNLLSLARTGVYRLRDAARAPTGPKLEAILRFDPDETFARWDDVSYAEFCEQAELPADLRLVFNTFSRAFFATADKMSMAELIKSFHFFYLSNDGGLLFEYLDDDLEPALLSHARAFMARYGVDLRTGHTVERIEPRVLGGKSERGFVVDGEPYHYLVLACTVDAGKRLLASSPALAAAAPRLARDLDGLRVGQRYAVVRLWLDRDHGPRQLPPFVITEREPILDAFAINHRCEAESIEWVRDRRAAGEDGGIYELHCYAVPDDIAEDTIESTMIEELLHYLPSLREAEILHSNLYCRRDFPAFHTGQHRTRPHWRTERSDLFLAGDWVKLDHAAMLMEAAVSSGLLVANAISSAHGVRERQLWRVPARGIMAGAPRRPGA